MLKFPKIAFLVVLTVLLAACGGGGSGSESSEDNPSIPSTQTARWPYNLLEIREEYDDGFDDVIDYSWTQKFTYEGGKITRHDWILDGTDSPETYYDIYTYDAAGQILTIEDPNLEWGHKSIFNLDDKGNVSSIESHENFGSKLIVNYTYSYENGILKSIKSDNENRTSRQFTVNGDGKVLSITAYDGSNSTAEYFTYDSIGRLIKYEFPDNSNETCRIFYNTEDRIYKLDWYYDDIYGNPQKAYEITLSYDVNGILTNADYNYETQARYVTFTFNDNGMPKEAFGYSRYGLSNLKFNIIFDLILMLD